MARGTRRLELFRDADDYQRFIQILINALRKSRATVWAYALMTNHYHLVIEATSHELSSCMLRLNRMYSVYHNERYGFVGHIFDGPYLAFRQRTPLLTLATMAYVFLNPVKAGACSAPEDYAWSSYRSFIGLPGSPLSIRTAPLLSKMDADLKKVWWLFNLAMKRELERPVGQVPGRPTMVEAHLSQFGVLLDYAQQQALLLGGEDPIPVAVYWGRLAGIAPRVMAKYFGHPNSKQVYKMLKEFKARLAKDPSLARLSTLP